MLRFGATGLAPAFWRRPIWRNVSLGRTFWRYGV